MLHRPKLPPILNRQLRSKHRYIRCAEETRSIPVGSGAVAVPAVVAPGSVLGVVAAKTVVEIHILILLVMAMETKIVVESIKIMATMAETPMAVQTPEWNIDLGLRMVDGRSKREIDVRIEV